MKNLKIIIVYSVLLLLLLNGVIAINSYFISSQGFVLSHAIVKNMDSREINNKQLKKTETPEYIELKHSIERASYQLKTLFTTSVIQLPLSVIAMLLIIVLRFLEVKTGKKQEQEHEGKP